MTSPEKATKAAISLMWWSERYFSIASLYRTADLRESVTIIALAWPSISGLTLARKCSTMMATFWLMLYGCSFTQFISDFMALDLSTFSES